MNKYIYIATLLLICLALLVGSIPTDAEAMSPENGHAKLFNVHSLDPLNGMIFTPFDRAISKKKSAPKIASMTWTKYAGNPVLDVGATGSWDSQGVNSPAIVFKDGIYEMWYAGTSIPNKGFRIGYATSLNGLDWTKSISNPVMAPGSPGSWDSEHLLFPHVIYHENVYKMWYRGTKNQDLTGASIGYATSTNGIEWVKYEDNPVLTVGSPGSWDSHSIFSANVIVDGSTYKAWYSGNDGANYRIGYATSPDGVTWTKYAGNPVLDVGPAGSWDSHAIYYPVVSLNGGVYEMWYAGSDGSDFGIGHVTSTDGILWVKDADNPLLLTGSPGTWDSHTVIPSSVFLESGQYRMWYMGRDAQATGRIGYATTETTAADHKNYMPLIIR